MRHTLLCLTSSPLSPSYHCIRCVILLHVLKFIINPVRKDSFNSNTQSPNFITDGTVLFPGASVGLLVARAVVYQSLKPPYASIYRAL
jgi:hypothetical protein